LCECKPLLGGTATCVYYQNYIALALLWIVGLGFAAKVGIDA